MKRFLIFTVLAVSFSICAIGQNLAFIGEKSFPCTETFILKSNSDNDFIADLKLVFAKDGEKELLIISSKLVSTVRISGKLIVYLDDGSVIACDDKGIKDNMDDVAITAYYLTSADIRKLEKSNINTVRYVVKCEECLSNAIYEGIYTASNKGDLETDFMSVTTRFFNQTEEQPYIPHKQKSETERKPYITNMAPGLSLKGRSLLGPLPAPNYSVQEEGIVVIAITVNKKGNVVNAEFELKGSTTQNRQLISAALKAASQTRFNSDSNAAAFQRGSITYHFELN
ncbi:TonB family C-terminal domain-containing protein [Saccharicrinis carchari]|uniref:TonB family C-terminal domain-containing protein n=1 Tax=Saccharicrinis carchari TaxID=1168039 RepID=A0A521F040_SACCC|nr:energy transducer TonB [Saccharicrinis carchari]SMO88800.1 TonB family C-terminal domain-containing protein [Saccharicrinis carchari]